MNPQLLTGAGSLAGAVLSAEPPSAAPQPEEKPPQTLLQNVQGISLDRCMDFSLSLYNRIIVKRFAE